MQHAIELSVPAKARDAALLAALEGVDIIEEDAREHAKRVLLQAQHDADIVKLKEENKELRKALEITKRRSLTTKRTMREELKTHQTNITEQLKSNNRMMMALFLVVILATAFQTEAGKNLALLTLQAMIKK